jgi:hypothetical protein
MAKGSTALCPYLIKKTPGNIRNSHTKLKTQRVDAASGASSAARGTAEMLAAHGAGEARRDMRRHPIRERSGLHAVRGGGDSTQGVVRVSDMDGERELLALGGQQLAHIYASIHVEATECMDNYVRKAVA